MTKQSQEAGQRRRDRHPARIQLNFTSMIDVVFLLLIYFITTVSFAVDEGVLSTKLPRGTGEASAADPPQRPLRILLTAVGVTGFRIEVEGLREFPTSFTALANILKGIQHDPPNGRHGAYKPDNPVVIRPDVNVRWQHALNAFNAVLGAGYQRVNFAQAREPG